LGIVTIGAQFTQIDSFGMSDTRTNSRIGPIRELKPKGEG